MSERSEAEAAGLPAADGPLVWVQLHDRQLLYAVVKGRRKERDGTWWCQPQTHLPCAIEQRGRLVDEPARVDFRTPGSRCEPIAGQAYDTVPTRRGVAPAWWIEDPVCFGPEHGRAGLAALPATPRCASP